jgi:hypothetical protein
VLGSKLNGTPPLSFNSKFSRVLLSKKFNDTPPLNINYSLFNLLLIR